MIAQLSTLLDRSNDMIKRINDIKILTNFGEQK